MFGKSLKNKKIIISAGASGIGLGIVKICLNKGATVVVNDISKKFIDKLKKNIVHWYICTVYIVFFNT